MVSDRVQRIGLSSTLRINAKAAQMKRDGIDVVNLSVGEPDFPTPTNIKEAAKRALDRNFTTYTANSGIIELRQAIAKKYQVECAAEYSTDQIIVSTGGKQALYNACIALLNKGDEVIIPAPYWVSYPQMVNLAKGVPIVVKTREENGFRLTVEELGRVLSAKTKLLILNNPSNPTGSAYTPDQLRKLIDMCNDEGVFVISDEIYEKLTYDGFKLVSVAALGEKTRRNALIVNGFSKAYSMTGWRLGWAVGPKEIIEAMDKVQSHTTSNTNSIAQWAGVEALNGPQHEIGRMCSEFERRRNYVLYRLNSIPHISCHKPEGAFYLFPNVSWYFDKQFDGVQIRNSAGLAYYLLKKAHVALVPGESFGADDFIRISYATSMENLQKAMDRVIEAMALLKPTFKTKKASLANTATKNKSFVETESAVKVEVRDGLVAEANAAMAFDSYHEWNVNIGGVVLKLQTNSNHLIDFWQENFYPSALESDLEPHGLLYGVKDVPGREPRAYYNPDTRTAMLFNSSYYPQLRSLALAMADDIAGRMFDLRTMAGACLDIGGRGIGLMAARSSGFSTHFAGLLRHPEVKLHSYDSYFVRWSGGVPIADSIERKFLMPTDLVSKLPELDTLFARSKCENVVTKRDDCQVSGCAYSNDCPVDRGEPYCFIGSEISRAMLDPYWIGGAAKHVKRTTMSKLILLKRDTLAPKVAKPNVDNALRILEEGGSLGGRGAYQATPYYNPLFSAPYGIVRAADRDELVRRFYRRLLEAVPLTVINTEAMRPIEAQETVWKIVTG